MGDIMATRLGKSFVAIMLVVMMLSVSSVIFGTDQASALTEGSYTYTVTGSEATITAYTGTDVALTIPSTLGTYPVVAIGSYAFTGVNSVTSVTIPGNVKLIPSVAFYGCNHLASITVDGANTNYASVGGVLYSHDLTTLVCYPKAMTGAHFDIPDGVTTIADEAFFSANHMTSVTIPDSVSSVGNKLFLACAALTSIAVDIDNPYYASVGGVLYSHDLTELVVYPNGLSGATFTIPGTVTKIYAYAFYNCRLTTVNIPDSVRSIGDHAFDQSSLTSLTIPDSVTSIGNSTFYNLVNLISASIGDGATYVGQYTFYYCYRMTSVSIGRNVTYIGEGAFGHCPLTSVNIPVNVTSIGRGAFTQNQISSITIPDNVRFIGDYAFANSVLLQSVTIPDSVITMGNQTFNGCTELASATIGNSVTYVGYQAFNNCPALTSVSIGRNVTSIGNSAFYLDGLLTSITIPGNVTSIGNSAFLGCSGLTSITFRGMVAPAYVGPNWVAGTNAGILGHAYEASNFPSAGQLFHSLLMGGVVPDVPGVPTGLTAGAGFELVTLNWTAPTLTSGYDIEYYIVNQDGADIDHITGTTATIPGLTNGQTYSFTIQAHTVIGTGDESAPATSTPSDVPGVPTDLNAVAGDAQVTLSWTAPALHGSAVDYYIVTQDGSALPTHYAGQTATITGLTNGQEYSFTVMAHNLGGYGQETDAVTATPYTMAGAATGLTPIPGIDNITLSWTAPADNGGASIDYYVVYQWLAGSWSDVAHATGTSIVISGLTTGIGCEFSVAAHNTAGLGDRSASVSVIPDIYITVHVTASAQYVNDTTAETVTLDISASSRLPSITLSSANVSYHLDGVLMGNTVLSVSGTWYLSSMPLLPTVGTNVWTFMFNDSVGNSEMKSITVIYENVDPTVSIVSPQTGSYNNTGIVTVQWTAAYDLSGIAYFEFILDSGTILTLPADVMSLQRSELADGSHTVKVVAYDNSGNHHEASVTFVVDTVDPTVSIDSPLPDSYNNGSMTLQWTSNDELSGIAYHEVSLDSGHILTLPSDVQSLVMNQMANGSHTVSVVAYDAAGNHKEASVTFIVDTVKPTLSISWPVGSYNNTGSILVGLSAFDLSGIAGFKVSIDDGVESTVGSGTPSYTFTDLADGPHTINIKAIDLAGNINETSESFIVDTVAPVITCAPASPIYTNDNAVEVHVSMSDTNPMTTGNVSLYSNGVFMEGYAIYGMSGENSSGYFALLYLEQGVNHYHVTVNDSAGNSNTIVVTIYRDITAPTVHINSPTNHAYNNTGSMALAWSSTDSSGVDRYEIFVNGGKVATLAAGTTWHVLSLPEGNDEIDVYVYDLAGNSAHATVNVIVDLTGPIVAITSPAGGQQTGSSVTVSWQGADPLSGLARYVVSFDGGDGLVLSTATHSQAFTGLASGLHTVSVVVYDNTGNSANDSVTFVVDSVTPSITSATPAGDNVSRTASIVIEFSEAMNQTSTTITIAGVNGTLTWSGSTATFTPSSALTYGTSYNVTVSGHDLAGNPMTSTESFTTVKGYGLISGVIKDAAGQVIADATVTLSNGMTTTTDANGAFSFSNVSAGSYDLTVGKTGYETVTQSVSSVAGETTALGSVSVSTTTGTTSNDSGMLVIAVIVGIVALLFVLILFVWRRKKKE